MRTGINIKAKTISPILVLLLSLSLVINSCQQQSPAPLDKRLKVVATTSLVGDVVSQVGGDKISLEVLLPMGTDPHSFSPSPKDASMVTDASIVFANGVGLEEFLKPLMESTGGSSKVVEVSNGIVYRNIVEQDSRNKQPVDDPHTWMDPNNIIIWVDNITKALSEKDPNNAEFYLENARNYQEKLRELDKWIASEVSIVPDQNRKLVTDHMVFGYFADRYGFTQVGAIIPGFSSLAEPSAQDIAQIEDEISSMGVKAIFIGVGMNSSLAQRIADDTGTQLVYLYMHSLSDKRGKAQSYIDFMQYDVTTIVDALK
jgi:manganese/iron transport system substrate-binding protein